MYIYLKKQTNISIDSVVSGYMISMAALVYPHIDILNINFECMCTIKTVCSPAKMS